LRWCWQQGPREKSSTSRVKPAGVGNDHRRRRSGNASCDQLKERPPVGDPRKLCRFSSRGCWSGSRHRRETAKAEDQQDCIVSAGHDICTERGGQAVRAACMTSLQRRLRSQRIPGMLRRRRKSALQSPGETVRDRCVRRTSNPVALRTKGRRKAEMDGIRRKSGR